MIIKNWQKLTAISAGAVLVALGNFGSAQAITLSNGSLSVDIRSDNGAIDTVTFGGQDFYNPGTPVSDFGFQNNTDTNTFVLNNTSGGTGQSVTVTGGPGSVAVTGTYTGGGANINFTRTYSLVPGQNVLRIATDFTNVGGDTTLSYFDTLDPDQVVFPTFNDAFNLTVGTATAKVGQASASSDNTSSGTPTLTALIGSLYADTTVASGNPFQINSGVALNNFFSSPFDGAGAYTDLGTHIGIRKFLASGSQTSFVYDQAYGLTPGAAQGAFLAANGATAVPFEFSPSLGFVILGAWGAMTQIKRLAKNRQPLKVSSL